MRYRMTVRTATDDDVDAIRQVAERTWETDYPDILTRETAAEGVEEWYAPEQLADELHSEQTELLVAERDGTVVGFAHGSWNDDREGYILRMYVHPEHRRENVGRELLEQTCAELDEQGAEQINAMVLAENTPGRTFYERFGFEKVDEQETTIGGESYREKRYVLDRPRQLDRD